MLAGDTLVPLEAVAQAYKLYCAALGAEVAHVSFAACSEDEDRLCRRY